MSAGFDDVSGLATDYDVCAVASPVTAGVGEVPLGLSPAHGGLEGGRYAILVLSENAEPPASTPATARAGLVATSDALAYGTTVDLSDGGFLPYVSSAGYDWVERVVSWTRPTRPGRAGSSCASPTTSSAAGG